MKDYYKDITKENLDLIRMYKDKCVDVSNQTEQNTAMVELLKLKNKELRIPLANALAEKDALTRQLKNYDKDIMALRNAKARLEILKKNEVETRKVSKDLEK